MTFLSSFISADLKDKIDNEDNGLFEKKQIQWFPLTKLKEDKSQIKLREFYKPLLETIVKNEKLLIDFIRTMD